MAADNFHKDCAPATVQGPEGAIDGEVDRLSGLPDDILLDILGRLLAVGDVRTVATTSSLSRRWRSLPWPQIPQVLLDVGHFFSRSDSDEWVRARRRHRFGDQHHAMAAFTGALARLLFLASKRFVERLALKFILTRRDYVRRIGELVGDAAAAGTASNIEFEIVTEMTCTSSNDHPSMISYGERFTDFVRDCPGAFRSLTKLAVQFLWFEDQDALRNLVRGCGALECLSLEFCGLLRPPAPDTDLTLAAALTIDAPESRLRTLVCDYCYIRRVELVQAPALVEFHHRWIFDDFSPPISCGCAPSLKTLSLTHLYGKDGLDIDVTWKLSELLVNVDKIETLRFDFENEKIWLQPETPRELRGALGGLKELHLTEIPPRYNLSWTLFLLEAAPLLETLDIHIFNHICRAEWRKKRGEHTNLTWKPSPDIMHHNLKKLSLHRAFDVWNDLPFARLVMELAVNLEALTLGVKSLDCEDCTAAESKFPHLARSRLRFKGNNMYVDEVVKKLKHGISTCAQITILLPE